MDRMEDDRIRTVTPDDLEAVNDVYNHYVRTSHVTFDLECMTLEHRRAWLKEHEPDRHPVLVATRASRFRLRERRTLPRATRI